MSRGQSAGGCDLTRLISRLSDLEAEIAGLAAGEVDAVIDPRDSAPLLLRKAQEALWDSEARYRYLLDTLQVMVCELRPDGSAIFMNKAAVALTGYTLEDLVGKSWWEMLLPGDLASQSVELRKSLAEGDISGRSLLVETKGNGIRVLELSSANLFGPGGTVERVLLLGTDMTAKKRADEMMRGLIRRSPLAIIVLDNNANVTLWNSAAERMFGWSEGEVLGRFLPIVPPGDLERFRQIQRRALAGEVQRGLELERRRKDGSLIEVVLWTESLHDPSGAAIATAGMLADNTERKRAERELLQAKYNAEAASRAKTAFLANMSHELRTPLNAIVGYAELLTDHVHGNSEAVRGLSVIERNAQHLLELINDVLDLSRIERKGLAICRAPCGAREIVEEVARTMCPDAQRKGLVLSVRCDTPVPERILSDELRIRQALINLVGNAIKYTDRGSVTIALGVPRPHGAERLEFRVEDTGIGIPREKLEEVFEPFIQGDTSTTRKFGGTGLGLTISRRLAHLLGGDVTVESEPGAGSTFCLTIRCEVPTGARWIAPEEQPAEALPCSGESDMPRTRHSSER